MHWIPCFNPFPFSLLVTTTLQEAVCQMIALSLRVKLRDLLQFTPPVNKCLGKRPIIRALQREFQLTEQGPAQSLGFS